MNKIYDPRLVDPKWALRWEQDAPRGPHAVQRGQRHFSIVIPPPNVTGSLHLGHALNNTLQDILVRWRRMSGDDVLWVPGTDHAGIATQNVVERQLAAGGQSRADLGRERFIDRVWEWKKQSGGTILQQLKRLGASCNWERERFTMDEGLSRAVRSVFVQLYNEGLIYRGERLIHGCVRCGTALSDVEVEHEETAGTMYHVQYPLADLPASEGNVLTVATTRPETMLADVAVAVHPDDPRFNRLIGKPVRLPLTGRTIPVVGDPILVDREFGTGAVKITPGHDFNDEKAGRRHRLPGFSLMTPTGVFSAEALKKAGVDAADAASLVGKTMLQARAWVVARLEQAGLLLKTEAHRHAVGKCYRCKGVVEPLLSTQWFVRMNDPNNSLAQPAIDAVRNRQIRLIPEQWEANYLGWMNNIEDWCISRQIWWGHAIPAWYCTGDDREMCLPACREPIVSLTPPAACPHCGSRSLRPDPDVLDTWFSSALWPFSTLGWPPEQATEGEAEARQMLARFYPTSVLVTSFDILFFWVARMAMMGLHFMKEVPFRTVYLHALVRDAEGQKMSKSKGNVVDPLSIMDEQGTDALRFTLAALASPGRDIRLSPERIEGYRNFANKLWNAARFIRTMGGSAPTDRSKTPTMADRWMIAQIRRTTIGVDEKLSHFRFDEAAGLLYRSVWHTFCDWYLEGVKVDRRGGQVTPVLSDVFCAILRLLHPFMPFITSELWEIFYSDRGPLHEQPYPTPDDFRSPSPQGEEVDLFTRCVIEPVEAIRTLRGEMNIPPSEPLPLSLAWRGDLPAASTPEALAEAIPHLTQMARLSNIAVGPSSPDRPVSGVVITLTTAWFDLQIELDALRRDREIERLEAERKKIDAQIQPLLVRLANPNFAKAPQAVQDEHRARLADLETAMRRCAESLARMRPKGDACG